MAEGPDLVTETVLELEQEVTCGYLPWPLPGAKAAAMLSLLLQAVHPNTLQSIPTQPAVPLS